MCKYETQRRDVLYNDSPVAGDAAFCGFTFEQIVRQTFAGGNCVFEDLLDQLVWENERGVSRHVDRNVSARQRITDRNVSARQRITDRNVSAYEENKYKKHFQRRGCDAHLSKNEVNLSYLKTSMHARPRCDMEQSNKNDV